MTVETAKSKFQHLGVNNENDDIHHLQLNCQHYKDQISSEKADLTSKNSTYISTMSPLSVQIQLMLT